MVYPLSDVVVVVPGITGSTLQRDGRDVWAPSWAGVRGMLATFGGSIRSLRLPDGVGDEHPQDGVTAGRLMPDLHLLPGVWTHNMGYDQMVDWLRSTFHVVEPDPSVPDVIPNLVTFPYDWRLSNRYTAGRLKAVVEPALERWRGQGDAFADAKLVFVCHSMGGLVARWYITRLGGAEITRRLVTFGTPYRGSINALDQLVNGVTKGWGPLKVDLTETTRSFPAVYQLLPEYACIEHADGLAKTIETRVPELNAAMVADAMDFHDTMNAIETPEVLVYPFVGYDQPTATTAAIAGGRVTPIPTFEGEDQGGDGTVPLLSASPKALAFDDPSISPVAEQHGTLQHNAHIADRLTGILRAPIGRKPRGPELKPVERAAIGVDVPDAIVAGEPVAVELSGTGERLRVTVTDEHGRPSVDPLVVRRARRPGGRRVQIGELPPGAHTVEVASDESQPVASGSVRAVIMVWEQGLA